MNAARLEFFCLGFCRSFVSRFSRLPRFRIRALVLPSWFSIRTVLARLVVLLTPATFPFISSAFFGQLHRNCVEISARPENFNSFVVWTPAAVLGERHGGHENTVNLKVSISSANIADGCTVVKQVAVQGPFGLFGAGGSPGPGSVVSLTGQLDLDTSAHRCSGLSG